MSPLCQADILFFDYFNNMISPVDVVRLHNALKRGGVSGSPSLAIAGFSSKGSIFGLYAKKAGFKIVAVSDESCSVVDIGGNGGLDLSYLIKLKKSKNFRDIQLKNVLKTKPEFLSRIEVDVLMVEVLEEALAEEVRARVVVELGKGLISKDASKTLRERRIPIIPLIP